MFKVGDKVRRVSGDNFTTPIGFEGVIRKVRKDSGDDWEYHFDGGAWGYHQTLDVPRWELVQPTSPVVTETVTKTRIVPGTYDGVQVGFGMAPRTAYVYIYEQRLTPDELDAAAAVLSTLAKGLRDA